MRWDDLFADLEAQAEAADVAELDAEVAERTRREAATVTWVDRAQAAVGRAVSVRVTGVGAPVAATLRSVGSQWLLLDQPPSRSVLIPHSSVVAVSGLGPWTAPEGAAGVVESRLGLGSALRAVARDRSPVQLLLTDGGMVHGVLDRVGADFVEISELGAGEIRAPGRGDGGRVAVRLVPFAAMAMLRSG